MSHSNIINRWVTCEALAKVLGVSGFRVRAWRRRNRIPAAYWQALIAAGAAAGHELTLEDFVQQMQQLSVLNEPNLKEITPPALQQAVFEQGLREAIEQPTDELRHACLDRLDHQVKRRRVA